MKMSSNCATDVTERQFTHLSSHEADTMEDTDLLNFLSKFGLERHYPNKLTLPFISEINKNSVEAETDQSKETLPWRFLQNLFEVNAKCRNLRQRENQDQSVGGDSEDQVSPLDVTVALFLCADNFLQQEMVVKMSMCQFPLPLVLPHGQKSQSTLMLWALRDIVKQWCPHETKGFVEDNIVQANTPFYSFVRLKNSSLSKSMFLNQLLSSNTFIHRDVEGGSVRRIISNGLVEVCWSLPSGNQSSDMFPEPVAFANLRGDICQSLPQFNFLFEVSTATFVFLDSFEEEELRTLTSLQDVKSKIFLVINGMGEDMTPVMEMVKELDLAESRVEMKDQMVDESEFSKRISRVIMTSLIDAKTTSVSNMAEKAVEHGMSVDEKKGREQEAAAEELVKEIKELKVPGYKKKQLHLQGERWKRLSQSQMEECRKTRSRRLGLDQRTSQLQEPKTTSRPDQEEEGGREESTAVKTFIQHVSGREKEKRDFFLKWMKLQLDDFSRSEGLELRNNLKEQEETEDALVSSSLGTDHYLREMGLVYQFSTVDSPTDAALPALAADLLLDGHPLELLDGDASNVPQRWVTDVLMELHEKVGQKSRLLVLTVLGVQSSGKSTLLNMMFGVQFPVSRHTRGASMLVLRVGEDLKSDLKCDFVVLIDTEGLKSPDLTQRSDSYEHHNRLATFVTGLSDVTIINVTKEHAQDVKDVLQVVIYTLLKLNMSDKKPLCHFVLQNVSDASAETKTATDRKHLLDQLNEITQVAAEMEKKHSVKTFTDVLDYDKDKNNWTIPGLWRGIPPMAPVNTGYSEAVADFRRNLLQTVPSQRSEGFSQIPDFVESIKSLWAAVRGENFLFTFRRTMASHAVNSLCTELTQWRWDFREQILSWLAQTQSDILPLRSQTESWNILFVSTQEEALERIETGGRGMKGKLINSYEGKKKQVDLSGCSITDVCEGISRLTDEIKGLVNDTLEVWLKLPEEELSENQFDAENTVMSLLKEEKHKTLSEEELTQIFESLWSREAGQSLSDTEVTNTMTFCFEVKGEHLLQSSTDKTTELQNIADGITDSCMDFVLEKAKTNPEVNEGLTGELLERVDQCLQDSLTCWDNNFEFDLKVYICDVAFREVITMKDRALLKVAAEHGATEKTQSLTDFLRLYKQRTDCLQDAADFVHFCIKPAVKDYISRSLGADIMDEMLTEHSIRSIFQYNILKELLMEDDFQRILSYIRNYEKYVKGWIFQRILQNMSVDDSLSQRLNKRLQVAVDKVCDAIDWTFRGREGVLLPESIAELISNVNKYLTLDLSLSVEAEESTLFGIHRPRHSFANCLKIWVQDLKEQLQEEFSNSGDVVEVLNTLPIKPQDELFKRVFGCGQQCPFCRVPCEAGGAEHLQHHAAVHRPQGLGNFKCKHTRELIPTPCTSNELTVSKFRNTDTKWDWYPYNNFAEYYPDWIIPSDPQTEASDYWKYVLVQYNDRFAEHFKAKPADVPEAWRTLTRAEVLEGLRDAFNIK